MVLQWLITKDSYSKHRIYKPHNSTAFDERKLWIVKFSTELRNSLTGQVPGNTEEAPMCCAAEMGFAVRSGLLHISGCSTSTEQLQNNNWQEKLKKITETALVSLNPQQTSLEITRNA
jgi:hypothetical protein